MNKEKKCSPEEMALLMQLLLEVEAAAAHPLLTGRWGGQRYSGIFDG